MQMLPQRIILQQGGGGEEWSDWGGGIFMGSPKG